MSLRRCFASGVDVVCLPHLRTRLGVDDEIESGGKIGLGGRWSSGDESVVTEMALSNRTSSSSTMISSPLPFCLQLRLDVHEQMVAVNSRCSEYTRTLQPVTLLHCVDR
ncbi:uncharacterized protein LOC143203476 isoform X1 [Rhynchophorus ferrugineus]|uniref:uncharacterized protein LOC143203476 isoform X1 n=1 Tax=Rhynchophorus ferrugineus TaxID=354439 RepID=UPI003FCC3CA1